MANPIDSGINLKRCPFCKSNVVLWHYSCGLYTIRCHYCGLETPADKDRLTVIKRWNNRPLEDNND